MKDNIHKWLNNWLLSRRGFFKCTGLLAGLYCARRWFKEGNSNALAQDKPRVVSVHDSNATNWDYATGYHWEYINQDVVDNMVTAGVMTLTGASNATAAWSALVPYQTGEAVAIKVNFNNAWGCGGADDNQVDAYPETANAVIDGLISIGVPANKIWITDPSRGIPSRFINKISDSSVQYYSTRYTCNEKSHLTDYVNADSSDASPTTHPAGDVVRPAQILVDADHLINIPMLKGHGSGWITLGLKNHYGSVIFKNYPSEGQHSERQRMHLYIEPSQNPHIEKSLLADITNNPHIRNKTRLIIGDGLFGNPVNNWTEVSRWQIFNNDDPNILFFGTDPIATDSVMCDYIIEEQGVSVIHSSLHYGAELGLGVHDHWDSFGSKQYSLIDYVNVDLNKVNRLDIDRKIRDFKAGNATEQDVKDIIEEYMETP